MAGLANDLTDKVFVLKESLVAVSSLTSSVATSLGRVVNSYHFFVAEKGRNDDHA